MTLSDLKITIIGAGIGGLACALALRKQGACVTVLEQAEAISEVGAGIQVSPNGMRVLEALGLAAELKTKSVIAQAISLRDYRRGKEVARLDLTALPTDQTYAFVHRADIIDILAKANRAAGVKIRLLQKVSSIQAGPASIVNLHTGDQCSAGLVIGADGVKSVVRTALNGISEPFFTGQVAWRAVVPNSIQQPNDVRVHMGPGCHVVSYPLRDGKNLNLVAVQERSIWAEEGWNHVDDVQNLRSAFSAFGGDMPQMLSQVTQPHLWGLFRHPIAQNWTGENVAILGDAAHPTLPFLAQGANMALEDAWVLADALRRRDTVAEALVSYQSRRKDRATRVINAANGNAWKYHLRFRPTRYFAHLGLSMLSRIAPARMLNQYDWLYGHDVTQSV